MEFPTIFSVEFPGPNRKRPSALGIWIRPLSSRPGLIARYPAAGREIQLLFALKIRIPGPTCD